MNKRKPKIRLMNPKRSLARRCTDNEKIHLANMRLKVDELKYGEMQGNIMTLFLKTFTIGNKNGCLHALCVTIH